MSEAAPQQSSSLLGYGLYFIDVLACLLFCVTLALVTARFGRETSVDLELPELAASGAVGGDLAGPSISLRTRDGALELFLEDEPVSLEELEARLRSAPPASVVVRSEDSALAEVIGIAHAAGVHDIELAYGVERGEKP